MPTPQWVNGTRLRARVWSGNGITHFKTWHDNVLDVDCAPETAGQGIRCNPPQHGVYFSDPACSMNPSVQLPVCDVPTHITEFKAHRQGVVRRVGAVVATPQQAYVDYDDGGGCRPTPVGGTGTAFHDVSQVVDDAQLVAFSVVREPRGTRLAADVLVGSDGSRDARFIVDVERNFHCGPRHTFIQGEICTPATLAFAYPRFADNGCTQRLGTVPLLGQRQPFLNDPPGVVVVDLNATPEPLLREPGAQYAGTSVYQLIGANCDPYTDLPPSSFVELGAPLSVGVFVPFSITLEGTQRVKGNLLRSPTGEPLYQAELMDTQLGTTVCNPLPASDGTVRCMPILGFATAFADPACQQFLEQRLEGYPAPPAVTQSSYLDQCNVTYLPVRVGAALAPGTTIYRDGGSGCYADTMTPGNTYYTTTPLLPAELEALTLVTQ